MAFNPNSDALYPCSLIQGRSLPSGVLNPIRTQRNAATITVTDFISTDPKASYSVRVKGPTLASITDAVKEVLNLNLQTEQPSKFTYGETSMSTVEEGLLKLGASFQWVSGNVSGSFQTNTSKSKTTSYEKVRSVVLHRKL